MKIKLLFLLISTILTANVASAVDTGQIQDDTVFNFSNGVNITVLALQNFSQITRHNNTETPQNTLEFIINGTKIQFNSTTNKTLYNISYICCNWTWKVNGTGNLFVKAIVNTNTLYGLYNGTGLVSNSTTDANGNFSYNITSITNGTYSIQLLQSVMPPTPINIASTTGNFWVNTTWAAGTGNTTTSYNVSRSGVWSNGLTVPYFNYSTTPHAWVNLSVYAHNNQSGGILNATPATLNTQVPNNAPTTPALTEPANNSNNSNRLTLLWSVTDVDSDTLTTHWQVATDLAFTTISKEGNTTSSSTSVLLPATDEYYGRVRTTDGYVWTSWSNVRFFNVTTPILATPTNGSNQTYSYPPQTENINFTWTTTWGTNGTSDYNIQIAKDVNFNLITVDSRVSTKYSVQVLQGTQRYWWRVRTYDSTSVSYGNWSDTYDFNLTANSTATAVGIQGVVYELINGAITPIDSASVFIYNATWSQTQITGSNGYYLFQNLANGSATDPYYIKATKQNYLDSQIQTVNLSGTIVTQDILMERCISGFECFYDQKHVDFYVSNPLGTEYTGVTVSIYKGDAVTATDIGTTGADGGFTSLLLIGQQYRITFVSTSQGVNEEMTVTIRPKGSDDSYTIYIWGFPSRNRADNITWNLSTSINNATTTWLNLSYTSDTATTIGHFWVKNETGTILYSETANTFTTWNTGYAVNDTSGLQYVWGFNATHPTWGYIDPSKSIQFRSGYLVDLKVSDTRYYTWFSVSFLVGLALAFSRTTNRNGYILIPLFAMMFWSFGWFPAGYQTTHFGVIFASFIIGMLMYWRTAEKRAVYPY